MEWTSGDCGGQRDKLSVVSNFLELGQFLKPTITSHRMVPSALDQFHAHVWPTSFIYILISI